MAELVKIQFLRGTKAQVDAAPSTSAGKPFYATDTEELYIADGSAKHLIGKPIIDVIASRPAFGTEGRVFVSTDENNKMYVDTGAAWVATGITDLADMAGDLDDIADGATYGKVANTELNTGQITQVRAVTGTTNVTGDTINDHITSTSNPHQVSLEQARTQNNQLAGNIDANSNTITNLATPTADGDAVNKAYVDAKAQGLDTKESVTVATDGALDANTPSGSGIGKLLTANANGALTIDGISTFQDIDNDGAVNDPLEPTATRATRVLVKDETAVHNGIYVVKHKGDGSNPWVLVRAIDFDEDNEVTNSAYTFVGSGTTNANAGFSVTTPDDITVDTTGITWTQFNGAGNISAGDGLTKTGNTLDVTNADGSLNLSVGDVNVNVDATTIVKGGGGALEVADNSITEAKITTSVAGDGLAGGNGTPLSVNVGNGLQILADTIEFQPDSTTGGTSANVVKAVAAGVSIGIDNSSIKETGNNLYVDIVDGGTLT